MVVGCVEGGVDGVDLFFGYVVGVELDVVEGGDVWVVGVEVV